MGHHIRKNGPNSNTDSVAHNFGPTHWSPTAIGPVGHTLGKRWALFLLSKERCNSPWPLILRASSVDGCRRRRRWTDRLGRRRRRRWRRCFPCFCRRQKIQWARRWRSWSWLFDNVGSFESMVAEKTNLPLDLQGLMYKGRVEDRGKTPGSYSSLSSSIFLEDQLVQRSVDTLRVSLKAVNFTVVTSWP